MVPPYDLRVMVKVWLLTGSLRGLGLMQPVPLADGAAVPFPVCFCGR